MFKISIYFISVLIILIHQDKLWKQGMLPWQLAEIKKCLSFYTLFYFNEILQYFK